MVVEKARTAVPTARPNSTIPILKKTSLRAASRYEISEGIKGWEHELYHSNQFSAHPTKDCFVGGGNEAIDVEQGTETKVKCYNLEKPQSEKNGSIL